MTSDPPEVAVTTPVVVEPTIFVLIVKVAEFEPEGTVTKFGTMTDGSLLFSVTISPPAGALDRSVTVPVEVFPPATELGVISNPVAEMLFT